MLTLLMIGLAVTLNPKFTSSIPENIYVASCPWLRKDTFCYAYITTTEKVAKVNVVRRFQQSIHAEKSYVMNRYDVREHALSEESDDHLFLLSRKNHSVSVFQSYQAFRVIVITRKLDDSESDAFMLTKKTSCSQSYIIVTANGYPFFTIFAFDYPQTKVLVTCPKSPDKVDSTKGELKNCMEGNVISFKMAKYQALYFVLDDYDSNLANVLITSDQPVYVVSGNNQAWDGKGTVSKGIATLSIQPSTTFGKHYMVHPFFTTTRYFTISSDKYPITVMFCEKDPKCQSRSLNSSGDGFNIKFSASFDLMHIRADDPFGLYETFTSGKGDVSVLNLVPIEQWKWGTFIVHLPIVDYTYTYFILTQKQKRISFMDCKICGVKWIGGVNIVHEGIDYFAGQLRLFTWNGIIYVGELSGRMMIYLFMQHKKRGFGLSTIPYDSYQGKIYPNVKCKRSSNDVGADHMYDGVDNDCDNYIDEEVENDIDDDRDGWQDEDSVGALSDGQWTEWKPACNLSLDDSHVLSIRVRSCVNRSEYGQFCQGENIQCDEKPCAVKAHFSNTSKTGCYCDAGCQTCERSMFECIGCREGYKQTENCLTKCKPGWSGFNCEDEVKHGAGFTSKSSLVLILLLSTLVFFILVVSMRFCCRLRRRRLATIKIREKLSNPSQDSSTIAATSMVSSASSAPPSTSSSSSSVPSQ